MTSPSRTKTAPSTRWLAAAALGIALLVLLAAASVGFDVRRLVDSFYPPLAATAEGRQIRDLYDLVFIFAAVIFFFVEGLIVWAVVRYRRRPSDEALPPQIHGNNALEFAWTIIPTLIVVILFFFSWQTLNAVDQPKGDATEKVRAVASRFAWQFEYLDASGQKLFTAFSPMVVPAGRKVEVTLYSPDVIHAFYVPKFLFKRDVVPGKENVFDFTVDPADAGQTFRGQCAELCGVGHYTMVFEVKALAPAEYRAWFAEQVAKAQATLPPAASQAPGAVTLELVAKDLLFDKTALEAPADMPFTIRFTNNDPGVLHNVFITDAVKSPVQMGDTTPFQGVKSVDYNVAPLAAGTYTYICIVHPTTMVGTLTVK